MNPITSAFIEASRYLGFVFEPDFEVVLFGGVRLTTCGLVRDFGSSLGTLLFTEASEPSQAEQAAIHASGYDFSVLFSSYNHYDESHFKATLNDWGYFGVESRRPAWYTGESWSEFS